MAGFLVNLKSLRGDMIDNEKAVHLSLFTFNGITRFIAVCLLTEEDREKKTAKYALVRLRFIDRQDSSHFVDCYANSNGLEFEAPTSVSDLRHFFKVGYVSDFKTWINSFYRELGAQIPTHYEVVFNNEHIDDAVRVICDHEKRNPNRTYRWSMIRHHVQSDGTQRHRTEYNAQLASVKFPHNYSHFANDKTVSFGFTENSLEEKTEEEVLQNFYDNELEWERKHY